MKSRLPRNFLIGTVSFGLLAAASACKSDGKASSAPATPTPASASVVVMQVGAPKDRTKFKDWKIAEEFDFDWQGNGVPAHFKIEQSEEEQVGRLTIHMSGQP